MVTHDSETLIQVIKGITLSFASAYSRLREILSEQELLDLLPLEEPHDIGLVEKDADKDPKKKTIDGTTRKKHRRRTRKEDEIHESRSADQISTALGGVGGVFLSSDSEGAESNSPRRGSTSNPSGSSPKIRASQSTQPVTTQAPNPRLSQNFAQTASTPADANQDVEKPSKDSKYERSIREFKKSRSTTSPHLKGLVRGANGSQTTSPPPEADQLPPRPEIQGSVSIATLTPPPPTPNTTVSTPAPTISTSPSVGSNPTTINPSAPSDTVKRLNRRPFNPIGFVQKRKKGDIHDNQTLHFLEGRPDLLNFKKDLRNLPIVKMENPSIAFQLSGPSEEDCIHSGTSDDSMWACCLSTYPLKASGQREGSPVCDYFRVTDLDDRIIVALCDGCSWGKNVREGAEKASSSFTTYLMSQMGSLRNTHDIGHALLAGLTRAHQTLVEYNSKKKIAKSATCTLLGGLLTRTHLSNREVGWVFIGVNLGDCKAYHYSHKNRTFTDLTPSNRLQSLDASDPGGRIGSPNEEPDLRNLELHEVICEPEDLLIFVTDGVHDNLDPELLAIPPCEIDPEESSLSWSQLPAERAKEVKAKFVSLLLKRLLISDIASTFLAPGEADSSVSTRLPESVIKDRRPRVFQPLDSCPPSFHFETTVRERSESSQYVNRSNSNEGRPPVEDIPYPAELSRPGTSHIGDASLEDILQTKGLNSIDFLTEFENSKRPSPRVSSAQPSVGSSAAGSINVDCCNKYGPEVSMSEEITYLKGLSTRIVASALVTHAARVTQSSRYFMETRSERLPSNYREYPGKMDHTTCITIRIPPVTLKS